MASAIGRADLRFARVRPSMKTIETALVQIGSGDDFGRSRCVDPETDQAANAACQIS
jgi:hypothetical protein